MNGMKLGTVRGGRRSSGGRKSTVVAFAGPPTKSFGLLEWLGPVIPQGALVTGRAVTPTPGGHSIGYTDHTRCRRSNVRLDFWQNIG
jgi:hypothetical protein